jgi:hypothetical protein
MRTTPLVYTQSKQYDNYILSKQGEWNGGASDVQ